MLRQCITFLRTRGVGAFLPLDHHIYLHKVTGITITVLSLVHTVMHLINDYYCLARSDTFCPISVTHGVSCNNLNRTEYTIPQLLFTTKLGHFGLIKGWANPTGVALISVLLVMFICSQPFVRRGGSFEIFYWTHLLYVPFWILVIFHGPNFWMWFIGPFLIYLLERTLK